MRDLGKMLNGIISEEAIGELMLAKNALEEKYELINEKDRMIQDLVTKNRVIEERLKEVEQLLEGVENQIEAHTKTSFERGAESVIKDIVSVLVNHERLKKHKGVQDDPVEKILECLEKQYGLKRIDEQPRSIDPTIHNVVEVVQQEEGEEQETIVVLSTGYMLKGKLLMPVKLRVISGGKNDDESPKNVSPAVRESLSLVEGGRKIDDEPKGAA
jgi:molecular chaperone GrpE (heat shock protein)